MRSLPKKGIRAALFASLALLMFTGQMALNLSYFRTGDDLVYALTKEQQALPLPRRLALAWHETWLDYSVIKANDRLIGQFVSRIIQNISTPWAALFKSLLFLGVVFIIFKVGTFTRPSANNPVFFLLTYLLFWLPSFPFGDTFDYNAGAGNYAFNFIIFFSYIYALMHKLRSERRGQVLSARRTWLTAAGFFLLGLLAGDSNENSSLALLGLFGFYILTRWITVKNRPIAFREIRKVSFPLGAAFTGQLLGAAALVLSPSFFNRLGQTLTVNKVMPFWLEAPAFFFLRYPIHLASIALVAFLVFSIALLLARSNTTGAFLPETRQRALSFLTLALLSNIILALGTVDGSRALVVTGIFLILVILTLCSGLKLTKLLRYRSLAFLIALLFLIWMGAFTIALHRSFILHKEWSQRGKILLNAKKKGENDIVYIPMYTQFPLNLGLYVRRTDFAIGSGTPLRHLERIYGFRRGQVQWRQPLTPRQSKVLNNPLKHALKGK